ncbi:hypothetical protein SRRS_13590 [Sporomusa rhizae]|uniref:TetR/AcrR family transcriptional regulator n=1 Tax=Sporomusa rhizae TaxID=357999 RepID=UPI00352A911A
MPKIIENVKQKIINEAQKVLLSGGGYRQLNIRDIAKRCGIGIGTFYNYFSNKEELAVEIFKQDWINTLILIEKLEYTDDSLKEKLRQIYVSLEGFIDRYMDIFHEIVKEEGYGKKQSCNYDDLYIKLQDFIEVQKQKGFIVSELDSRKLCYFIVSNFMYLSKTKYMSYDELFENMKI